MPETSRWQWNWLSSEQATCNNDHTDHYVSCTPFSITCPVFFFLLSFPYQSPRTQQTATAIRSTSTITQLSLTYRLQHFYLFYWKLILLFTALDWLVQCPFTKFLCWSHNLPLKWCVGQVKIGMYFSRMSGSCCSFQFSPIMLYHRKTIITWFIKSVDHNFF